VNQRGHVFYLLLLFTWLAVYTLQPRYNAYDGSLAKRAL